MVRIFFFYDNRNSLWIRKLNIIRMAMLLKLIYRYSAIPIRIPSGIFADVNKLILKFIIYKIHVELQEIQNNQNKPEKEQIGGLTVPGLKT